MPQFRCQLDDDTHRALRILRAQRDQTNDEVVTDLIRAAAGLDPHGPKAA